MSHWEFFLFFLRLSFFSIFLLFPGVLQITPEGVASYNLHMCGFKLFYFMYHKIISLLTTQEHFLNNNFTMGISNLLFQSVSYEISSALVTFNPAQKLYYK